ncbi:zf-DNL-domain-containing protein [Coniochaeta ligniaria NRRL 30616]|uniref:Zf-DNL-domain-containing protein n=1 Tax=Coniochaeta ligniaria NRRL 30616 TaxID=1408157 RepID=A0A1J7J537_9PEZI|nr:zf-DNL-domain-containing protein [Coniochaeta ligniaria NRRL 30616]
MASRRVVALANDCLRIHTALRPRQLCRPQLISRPNLPSSTPPQSQTPFLTSIRQKHTIPRPPRNPTTPPPPDNPSSGLPSKDPNQTEPAATETARSPPPQYELTFTCVPCDTRSKHKVSKQGYHHGSVLIACPNCKNRHVISDHLKIFGDRRITVEDLMRERGQLVKRGTLGEDGDVEFWDDGTSTPREKEEARPEETGDGWRAEAPGSSFKNKAGGDASA